MSDERPFSEAVLTKNELAAYTQHLLLHCVGIDRSFYCPLIVRTVHGVTGAEQNAYVTISNKAERCAPLSARALAERLVAASDQANNEG